jgi:hypothetical protein
MNEVWIVSYNDSYGIDRSICAVFANEESAKSCYNNKEWVGDNQTWYSYQDDGSILILERWPIA